MPKNKTKKNRVEAPPEVTQSTAVLNVPTQPQSKITPPRFKDFFFILHS